MSTFPQPWISTTSHWQATNKGSDSLWSHNAEAPLPPKADIVIIGAGLAGSALAYFLTRPGAEGEGKRIVVLEAKDVASGATGRNGGHVGPSTYDSYHHLLKPFPEGAGCSSEEAVRIIQAERDNLELVAEIIEKESLDVDFWKGHLVEVHETLDGDEGTLEMRRQYYAWLKARSAVGLTGNGDTQFIDDPEEAKRISRFVQATSVHLRPAGSVHSHRFCTALLQRALATKTSDLSFHSWTPVSSLTSSSSTSEKDSGVSWTVQTSKGPIVAPRVVLATNAHTPNFPLEPAVRDFIMPKLAQCCAITPPPSFSGATGALKNTFNMPHEGYLIQTPSGTVILGGGFDQLVKEGKMKREDCFGKVDDSIVHPALTKWLASYCKEKYHGWGSEGHGEGLTRVWTGVLTSVKDTLPLVGPVPRSPGLYIVAGFNGHGMSRIGSCTRALAELLRPGAEWDEALLPRSFELSDARLEKVRLAEEAFSRQGEEVRVSTRGTGGFGEVVESVDEKGRPVKKKVTQEKGWGCVIA